MSRVQRKHDDLSERDLKIVEMRDKGKYKLREIAEVFGISRQRVLQICDREGCRKLRLITDDERKLIVAMYNEGHGIIEVGRKFSRSPSTIRAICVAAGVRIRQRRRHSGAAINRRVQTERERQIVTLYSEGGHTQIELAKMFDTTQASISRIIRRSPRK